MQKVFSSNSKVIHLFAQQTQDEGRTGNGNVYFYGTKLYSYGNHYLLAEFIDSNTVVINDEGYSNSTAKHINIAIGATSQYKQYFKTNIDIDTIYRDVHWNLAKLAVSRKPEMYINPILGAFDRLNTYITERKNKTIQKSPKYKDIKRIVKKLNNNSEDFKAILKAEKLSADKREKKATAKRLITALADFNSYKINWFREGKEDYLRISKDGLKVETSQNVSIKRENAKTLYQLIQRGVEIKGRHIEHYVITSMNGTLKVGCHSINMDSVHKVGKELIK